MSDKISVWIRGEKRITEETTGKIDSPTGVTQVEINFEGHPERLILYPEPGRTSVSRNGPTLVVRGVLPCFFSVAEVGFEIDFQNRRVIALDVGNASFLKRGRNWKKGESSVKVKLPGDNPDPSLITLRTGVKFLARPGDRPGGAAPGVPYHPPILASLEPFLVNPGTSSILDNTVTIVLEAQAQLDGSLNVYGSSDPRSDFIRLVQLPDPFQKQAEGAQADARTWFVGVLGLPYSWGQPVWDSLLGEQVRSSQFDPQHGALFAPLLGSVEHPSSLQWDLAFRVVERLSQPKSSEVLLHGVRMTSPQKEKFQELSFPLLQSHRGSPLAARLPIAQGFLANKDLNDWSDYELLWTSLIGLFGKPGLSLGLRKDMNIVCLGPPEARTVRIGALDLTFSESSARPMSSEPDLRWQFVESGYPELKGRYQPDQSFIDFDWAVDRALPGGQDDLPDEIYVSCDLGLRQTLRPEEQFEREIECAALRERPLVIPLVEKQQGAGQSLSGQTLILKVRERARSKDARRIDLELQKLPKALEKKPELQALVVSGAVPTASATIEDACQGAVTAAQDGVVILDREPFLVAKVNFPPLGALENEAEGNEVANWSNHLQDAGTWHIRFPNAQSFCLTLPPQGVGETMEKNKTLEESAMADFRLSPPALLSLRERYYRQNFPTAPWNLHRLLNDPSRELPGVQLEHFQYELLYGLSCRVEYPFMRLAEISSLVGEVVGPLLPVPSWAQRTKGLDGGQPTSESMIAYKKARGLWAKASHEVRQRLGVFELWDMRQLDTLQLKEGVTCWIRDGEGQGSTPKQLDSTPPADLANPFAGGSGKLKGGVTWGFESRNVYNAVMQPIPPGPTWPRSSGAEIGKTWLSALGGYGHQMAAFDNWRTKILVDASMGRTYSYTLERIGRIGVWWNRAKHVIIYQRTVVPSIQFGSLKDDDQDAQNPLEGRTVLRKVEEYVEILQNTRAYPDSPQGQPRFTGFITECSFSEDPNQVIRFHVRSSWGAEVGTIGWKVPIWRPGEIPGDLYPQPVVNLTIMASVNGESVPRKVTIADPQNLFFFTDTTKPPEAYDDPSIDLSNTDNWLPVEDVDYVDQARPQPGDDTAFANGSLQQASAGDSVLPAGFRPCTFLIEPAEHTVDLLAHREGDPMGAALSSVTLCRAQLGEAKEGLGKDYRALLGKISEQAGGLLGRLPDQGRIADSTDLVSGIRGLCQTVAEGAQNLTGRISDGQLNDNLDLAIQQARQGIDKELEKLIGRAEESELGRSLARSLEEVGKLQQGLRRERLEQDLKREVASLVQYVSSLLPSPMVLTDSVQAALQEARRNLQQAVEQGKDFRDRVLAQLDDTKSFEPLVKESEAYLIRIEQVLERLRRLAESGTSIQINTSGAERMVPFLRGAKVVLEHLQVEIKAIEARLPVAREAVDRLRKERDNLRKLSKEFKGSILASLRQTTGWIDGVKNTVDALGPKITELDAVQNDLASLKQTWAGKLKAELLGSVDRVLASLPEQPAGNGIAFPEPWTVILRSEKTALLETVVGAAKGLATNPKLQEWFKVPQTVSQKAQGLCKDLEKDLKDLLANVNRDAEAVRRFLEARRDETLRELDRVFGDEVRATKKLLGEVESTADNALKLARAFGKPPEVSGLKFDRPEIAFFYHELDKRVGVTPVIARAAQVSAVADALKPFGIDLPVKQLGEQLIPADLKNFDLSSILPNIAGIPLKNLFSGLKMPDTGDSVKVRHGVDRQTRRAWVNVDVGFKAPGNTTLFAVGPLAVLINEPYFGAEARVEASLEGVQERRVKGRLSGTWRLQVGGFELISFKDTPLEFDEAGKIRFDVDPRNVQMTPALEFLNALLSSLSPGGLTTRFDGSGVVSTLDLPIPDTQIGAFGFSGLRLGASLALRYGGRGDQGGGFNIGVTASLGRRDAPFNLSIFILGGGGYLELGSRYYPSSGKVEATADLAIMASASLAIALGPIRGGVAVYVGVTATYSSLSGGGLYVGLVFMVSGYVSVLSIASATITLRLDAQYQGGALVGQGHLEIRIKICWCFTLEVSESVTYTLGRSGSGKTSALGGPRAVAQIASLNGFGDADLPVAAGFDPGILKQRINEYFLILI